MSPDLPRRDDRHLLRRQTLARLSASPWQSWWAAGQRDPPSVQTSQCRGLQVPQTGWRSPASRPASGGRAEQVALPMRQAWQQQSPPRSDFCWMQFGWTMHGMTVLRRLRQHGYRASWEECREHYQPDDGGCVPRCCGIHCQRLRRWRWYRWRLDRSWGRRHLQMCPRRHGELGAGCTRRCWHSPLVCY